MNNVSYNISEVQSDTCNKPSFEELLNNINKKLDENNQELDENNQELDENNLHDMEYKDVGQLNYDNRTALVLNYSLNYTVRALQLIAQYYNITFRRFKKHKLITKIVDYEINKTNSLTVLRRKQLWFYINEIKSDHCLKKFILVTNHKDFTQD
jgi:hypothetical protein